MSIQNILNSRESGQYNAALRKATDGKVTVKVSPNLSLPSKIDVTVKNFGDVLRSLALLGKGLESIKESLDKEQSMETDGIIKAIESLKKTLGSVPKSTKLADPVQFPKSFKVDNLNELKSGLVSINDNLVKLAGVIRDNKTEIPGNDDSGVISAVSAVENAIKSMVFPIPTPGTPSFKNSAGVAVSVTVDGSGNIPVSGSFSGGGDGAIVDGVSAAIKATVLDYASSNPLAVRLTDTAGDYIAAGAGTQYTEDVAAAADPVGTMAMAVRADTPAAVTSTDGDNVALRATNKGEQYVKHVDAIPVTDNSGSLTVDNAGTFAVQATLAAGNNNVGDIDVVSVPAPLSTTGGGTEATALRVTVASDSTGVLSVDDNGGSLTVDGTVAVSGTVTVGSHAVTNAGTFVVQENGAALTSLQLIDDSVTVLGTDTYTEAASKGVTIGAVRRDADTTLVNTTNEFTPLQVDANGRLKVEAFSGETLPVSLTSTTITGNVAVTQSGTWDEVGINDSGNSITVDNGGTFVVQENGAALTSLQLIDDAIYTDDTSTHSTGTSKGVGIMATATPTDTSVNANDIGMVAMTTDRRLLVDASGVAVPITDNSGSLTVDYATTGSGTATGALRVELPTNGTGVVGLNAGTALVGKVGIDQTTVGTTNAVSVAQLGANTVATGNGASSTGVLRVAQVNDGTGVLATVSTVTNLSQLGGTAIAMNTGIRSAGTQRVTIATDDIVPASQSGTWTVQPGNTANSTPWLVTDSPAISGGLSKFHLVGAATDNATNVKASAGQVYSITAFNLNASPRYLKFHNTAGTPTAGTGVTDTYLIPGNTSGAGLVINIDKGIAFGTGIGISIVTGIADSNTTAISASEVVVNIYYK